MKVPENLLVTQLVKDFIDLGYITVRTRAWYWSLTWTRQILFMPSNPVSLCSILLFSFHPCQLSQVVISLQLSQQKIVNEFLIYPVNATCPTNLILLHLIFQIIFGEEQKSMKFFIMQSSPVSSCFLALKSLRILLSILFSSILNLRSSLMWKTKMTPLQRE